MPPKQPGIDKLTWLWAESTDPENIQAAHIRTAYRLNLPICQLGKCRRQCKGNPYCLNCIGERIWFGEIEEASWHDIPDPEDERRTSGMFVGLKNLGATCYVNTFLQLWFHNETVKQGIYQWREGEVSKDKLQEWKPTSACSHLQVIFGLLEMSKRKFVDPSEFIKHLGLDTAQQQDAQEFSKLFLSVLEQSLVQSDQSLSPTHNVIKDQFCGSYAYFTRCSSCQNASERMSEFYELDLNLQGNKTLEEALKKFLEVEKLEGDNQYMCCKCNGKRNATRAIELKSLPPVLNLQLLRFVYDIKTGSKKKLNSCIQFPEILDMGSSLGNNVNAVYELSAVLIHRGPSAYSGHYVAHIKGKDNQAWYKFNDEDIEKIKGRNLQLGNEEDLELKQKKSRTPKGYHTSKNAYMLVYTKRCPETAENCTNSDKSENVSNQNIGFNANQAQQFGDNLSSVACDKGVAGIKTMETCQSKSENFGQLTQPQCVVQNSMSLPNVHKNRNNSSVHTTSTKCSTDNHGRVDDIKDSSQLLPDYVKAYVEKDNESFEKWIQDMNDMKRKNIETGQEKQETVKSIFQDLVFKETDNENFGWIPMQWLSKWLDDPSTAPAVDVSQYLCSHGKICPEQSQKMKCVSTNGYDQLCNIYGGEKMQLGNDSLCYDCVRAKCKIIRTKQRMAEDDKFISLAMKTNFLAEKCFWIGKGSYRSWRRLALERLSEEMKSNGNELKVNPVNQQEQSDTNSNQNTSLSNSTEYVPIVNESNTKENNLLNVHSELTVDKSVSENSFFDDTQNTNKGINTKATLSESDVQSNCSKTKIKNCETTLESKQKVKKIDDESLQFNEDLLCDDHMGLDPDETCRRLVPESVWTKMKQYFPGCPEFDYEMPSCEKCRSIREAENETKRINKQMAMSQKSALSDLFHDRKRPTVLCPGVEINAVSTEFINLWRQFLRDPVTNEPIEAIINGLLLCKHSKYVYPTTDGGALLSDDNVTFITNEEWQKLKEFYSADCEIDIICIVEDGQSEIVTVPDVCHECVQDRLYSAAKEIYDYDNKVVYVRKKQKSEKTGLVNNSSSCAAETVDGKEDQEFNGLDVNASGKKRLSTTDADFEEPPEKSIKLSENGKNVRKSQRHRRVRGEKDLTVSSKMTLKDLKLQIMKLFSVPPFDQNLYIQGRLLTDNSCSLGYLKVAPGSVIDLIADEPDEEHTFLEDLSKESGVPESGFKGTNLLSS